MKKFLTEWKQEISEMLNFLKAPHENFDENLSFRKKLKTVTALYLAEIVFTFLIVFPLLYLVDEIYHIRYTNDLARLDIYVLILLAVFAVPFLEEAFFRYPLKYRNNPLMRFLDLFSQENIFKKFWLKNYRFFFYASAIIFGLVHITNYENRFTLLLALFTPFIILSQLASGFVMGYLRVRLGFLWGFLYHAIWNFVAFIVPYLLFHNTVVINISGSDKEIKLTELAVAEDQSASVSYDIKGDKVYHFDLKNSDIQLLLDQIAPGFHSDDQFLINFEMKSKKGITKQELFKILDEKIDLDSINN